MTCLTCRVEMVRQDDHYFCPICEGEFFPAGYFGREYSEEEERLWAYYRRLYCKALRDERATAKVDRRMWQLAGI